MCAYIICELFIKGDFMKDKLEMEIENLERFLSSYPREKGSAFILLQDSLNRKKRMLKESKDSRSPLAKKIGM